MTEDNNSKYPYEGAWLDFSDPVEQILELMGTRKRSILKIVSSETTGAERGSAIHKPKIWHTIRDTIKSAAGSSKDLNPRFEFDGQLLRGYIHSDNGFKRKLFGLFIPETHNAWHDFTRGISHESAHLKQLEITKHINLESVPEYFLPINPILFATMLSYERALPGSQTKEIQQYCAGLAISHLEQKYLKLRFNSPSLKAILDHEQAYINAIQRIGLEILVLDGKLLPKTVKSIIPTMWDVLWGAWIAINPSYRHNSFYGLQIALKFALERNTEIHRAREHYDSHLNKTRKRLNRTTRLYHKWKDFPLMPKKSIKGNMQQMIYRQEDLSLLSERAIKLYHWSPPEIMASASEMERALFLETLGFAMQGHRYTEHILPQDIVQKVIDKELQMKTNLEIFVKKSESSQLLTELHQEDVFFQLPTQPTTKTPLGADHPFYNLPTQELVAIAVSLTGLATGITSLVTAIFKYLETKKDKGEKTITIVIEKEVIVIPEACESPEKLKELLERATLKSDLREETQQETK